MLEEKNSDNLNEENEKLSFPDCDGSEIDVRTLIL